MKINKPIKLIIIELSLTKNSTYRLAGNVEIRLIGNHQGVSKCSEREFFKKSRVVY